jgi:hypothetical protein
MALTRDQIDDLAEEGVFLGNVYEISQAIEAEVRKQDDALIRQLVEALCECAEDSQEQLDRMEAARLRDYKPNAIAWQEDTIAKAKAAITAARARLGEKT